MTALAPELRPTVAARLMALLRRAVRSVLRRPEGARGGVDADARRGFLFSSLSRHILAINLLVLAVPIGGVFYLNRYQNTLIVGQVTSLKVQAQIFAGALGASAVDAPTPGAQQINVEHAQELLRRLVEPTATRARLFDADGALVSDTRAMGGQLRAVRVNALPTPDARDLVTQVFEFMQSALDWLPGREELPLYVERPDQSAADYFEARQALAGEAAVAVRDDGRGGMLLSIAVPVQRYKQVLGAVMVSTSTEGMEQQLRAVRLDILKLFGITIAVTVLLSLYLGGTIARPLRRLARTAERVRRSKGREIEIPDLTHRNDEIGELSRSLKEMTEALWARMDAIERFAADVAHEIKNPLSSMRSAVETAARVTDPAQQKKLMAIIVDDVIRLNRLISDVSEASRLDSELSRQELERVDLRALLEALGSIEAAAHAAPDSPRLVLDLPPREALPVLGAEARMGQVFRNVIQNALSFSPPRGRVVVKARRVDDVIRVSVEDDGSGIPEGKLEAVFDRFYSDRPQERSAKFGVHSGLGLSISRQIVEASGGRIWAENRHDAVGRREGARFTIELPAHDPR